MAKKAPRRKPSEEASRFNLALASAQGATFAAALKHMATFVADDGREVQEGEYLVAYAVEEAKGLYHLRRGKLEWMEPTKENVHVEVVIRDGSKSPAYIQGRSIHSRSTRKLSRIGARPSAWSWSP